MNQTSIHIAEMNPLDNLRDFAACKKGVIETLTYFDIFQYPLTLEEIIRFLPCKVDELFLQECMIELQKEKVIFHSQGFYSIQNNPLLGHRRKQGNKLAEKLSAKASKIGRFLYQFPFVRAVGISGSLSKNYADENADIDFFIITKGNRLWIARTLMHLFKKFTFLTGTQHYYCMNYYIDEEALLLEEKNIYTAMEIKTLLPVSGKQTIEQFFGTNSWTADFLPVCHYRRQEKKDPPVSGLKKITEWILKGKIGDRLENYFFRLTRHRWKKKTEKGKLNNKGLVMNIISGKHFARSNPGSFQEKVLALYDQKLAGLNQPVYKDHFIVSSVK